MAWKLVVVLERGVQIEGEGGRVKDLEEAEVEVGRVLKLWRWKESNDNNRLHRSLLWRSRSGMRRCSYTRWHTVHTVGWARGGSHCRRTGHHTTTCPEGNPSIRNAASVYWPLPGGHPFLGWVQCLSQNPCTLKQNFFLVLSLIYCLLIVETTEFFSLFFSIWLKPLFIGSHKKQIMSFYITRN